MTDNEIKFYYTEMKNLYKKIENIYKNIEYQKNMIDLHLLNITSDAENVQLLSNIVADNAKIVTEKTINFMDLIAKAEKTLKNNKN